MQEPGDLLPLEVTPDGGCGVDAVRVPDVLNLPEPPERERDTIDTHLSEAGYAQRRSTLPVLDTVGKRKPSSNRAGVEEDLGYGSHGVDPLELSLRRTGRPLSTCSRASRCCRTALRAKNRANSARHRDRTTHAAAAAQTCGLTAAAHMTRPPRAVYGVVQETSGLSSSQRSMQRAPAGARACVAGGLCRRDPGRLSHATLCASIREYVLLSSRRDF